MRFSGFPACYLWWGFGLCLGWMMLLSQNDLIELTDYELAAYQIKWLREHGWKFDVGASGRPKVSRAYFEQRMGVVTQDVEPDFSIFEKRA